MYFRAKNNLKNNRYHSIKTCSKNKRKTIGFLSNSQKNTFCYRILYFDPKFYFIYVLDSEF
jgi:hypothetical protein